MKTLPILWSIEFNEEFIDELIKNDKIIESQIKRNCLRIRMFENNNEYEIRNIITDPRKPHIVATDMIKSEEYGWDMFIEIPEAYKSFFEAFDNPVIHPIMLGNPNDINSYRIAYFRVIERSMLEPNRTYSGLNKDLPTNEKPRITKISSPTNVEDSLAVQLKYIINEHDKSFRKSLNGRKDQPDNVRDLLLDITGKYRDSLTDFVDMLSRRNDDNE